MRPTVAGVLADGLARAGAARLFVTAGAPRALTDAVGAAGLDVVEVATAYDACVMAAVTGEITERPGAAWAPLAGNVGALADALAAAARDRAPTVVLSDVSEGAGLLAPATRSSSQAEPASVSHWIAHAARAAMNEPRGPAHVAVDPLALEAATAPAAASCLPDPSPTLPPAALDALASAVAGAARPVVVTGLGCRAADAPWVRALAEALPAPVLATPKGKGALPDPHPLALGAWSPSHPLLGRADLVIALGVTADEVRPSAWPEAAVAVARSADALPSQTTLVGDLASVLEELAPRLREARRADWDVAELDRIRRAAVTTPPARPFGLGRAVAIAREMTPVGTRAAFDSPLAEGWAALAPHECLAPAGYATDAYALPAAMAAALLGDVPAVAFTTFGLARAAAAWQTARRLALPLVLTTSDAEAAATLGGATHAGDELEFRRAFDAAWRRRVPSLLTVPAPR